MALIAAKGGVTHELFLLKSVSALVSGLSADFSKC